ncbi:hypothetical protein GCM10011588_59740 [Nocardia jinanensis]|uniref:Uncharacterized protein n=1 Tax=Nocardia jinanensis TaxID=382504 RepID=A0A917RVJ2_9NOCA|nr:hypothetical protein GCM10011588_59740 [Nocardia jinanensis]
MPGQRDARVSAVIGSFGRPVRSALSGPLEIFPVMSMAQMSPTAGPGRRVLCCDRLRQWCGAAPCIRPATAGSAATASTTVTIPTTHDVHDAPL